MGTCKFMSSPHWVILYFCIDVIVRFYQTNCWFVESRESNRTNLKTFKVLTIITDLLSDQAICFFSVDWQLWLGPQKHKHISFKTRWDPALIRNFYCISCCCIIVQMLCLDLIEFKDSLHFSRHRMLWQFRLMRVLQPAALWGKTTVCGQMLVLAFYTREKAKQDGAYCLENSIVDGKTASLMLMSTPQQQAP